MAGRCTAAFYKIMGVDDCIAKDYDDFIDIAVKLGECVVCIYLPFVSLGLMAVIV